MAWMLKLTFWLATFFWRLTRPVTLGVRVLLVKDGQVLLIRHTYMPGWHPPGGGVQRGESLPQAARREAAEEVGAQLPGELRLWTMLFRRSYGRSDHEALYVCEDFALASAPTTPAEIAASAFFPLDHLPPDLAAGYAECLQAYRAARA